MPHRISRSSRRLFWLAVRSGRSVGDAARDVGVSHTVAKHWFIEGGGMPSLQLAVKVPSRHLTAVDREVIYQGLHTESSLVLTGAADEDDGVILGDFVLVA